MASRAESSPYHRVAHDVHGDEAERAHEEAGGEQQDGVPAGRGVQDEGEGVEHRAHGQVGLSVQAEYRHCVRYEAEQELQRPGQRLQDAYGGLHRGLGVKHVHHVHVHRGGDEGHHEADSEIGLNNKYMAYMGMKTTDMKSNQINWTTHHGDADVGVTHDIIGAVVHVGHLCGYK